MGAQGRNCAGPKGEPSRLWLTRLAKYRFPSNARAIAEILLTAGPLAGLWLAASLAASVNYGLAMLLAIPAAGFLVRLFMLQHDCGHGTLFADRTANDWAGRVMAVFTLTPYDCWRRAHSHHHAGSGNLDRRGIGDIATLTVREYDALAFWGRFKYRLYRHPLVMLGLGPSFLFVIQHRWPSPSQRGERSAWLSAMATNAAILAVMVSLAVAVGLKTFLAVHVPLVMAAATIGVWLFYVQHQFEETYWATSSRWSPETAALSGSSYLVLPPPLRWLTANIGLHHVHHLSSRIPFYRLPAVLRDWPELDAVQRLSIGQSLLSLRLALWDEDSRRLVSFDQHAGDKRLNPAAPAGADPQGRS